MFSELSCNSYILKNENLKFELKKEDLDNLDKMRGQAMWMMASVNKWPAASAGDNYSLV